MLYSTHERTHARMHARTHTSGQVHVLMCTRSRAHACAREKRSAAVCAATKNGTNTGCLLVDTHVLELHCERYVKTHLVRKTLTKDLRTLIKYSNKLLLCTPTHTHTLRHTQTHVTYIQASVCHGDANQWQQNSLGSANT